MSVVQRISTLSVDEYLSGELKSDIRHELVCGQVFAMVGASNYHNLLAGSLYSSLRHHLNRPCRVYMSDMKVRVGDDFYYPDVVVSCKLTEGATYYLTEPVVIIEVLSPTTERQDRLEKRLAYQSLYSLQEYVLISQDRLQIEVYRRLSDGWEIETFLEGDVVRISSLNYQYNIDQIYEDILT